MPTNASKYESATNDPLLDSNNDGLKLDSPTGPKQISLFYGNIKLNPGISIINFVSFLTFAAFNPFILVPLSMIQGPLLENVFGLEKEEDQNTANTIISLSRLATGVLTSSWIGWGCDKFGRRPTIYAGIMITALSTFFCGDAPSLYPWYILLNVVQEFGAGLLVIPPLLADYADYETKGRVAGLSQVVGYATLSIMMMCVRLINPTKDLTFKFRLLGLICLLVGIFILFGVKGGDYHKHQTDRKQELAKKSMIQEVPEALEQIDIDEKLEAELHRDAERELEDQYVPNPATDNEQDVQALVNKRKAKNKASKLQSMMSTASRNNYKPGFMAGLREARNPWIAISYCCGFLSQANMALLYYVLMQYCIHEMEDPDKDERAKWAMTLNGKHYQVGIITAIFFGFFSDRYNKLVLIMVVYISGIVAVAMLLLSPHPRDWPAHVSMYIFGISGAGNLTTLAQLQAKYANPRYRASVVAVGQALGAMGAAATSILGAQFMHYNIRLPFYIYLGCAAAAGLFFIYTFLTKRAILTRL